LQNFKNEGFEKRSSKVPDYLFLQKNGDIIIYPESKKIKSTKTSSSRLYVASMFDK